MIDVHTHARTGWKDDEAVQSVEACGFDRAVLSSLPIDHWGVALPEECARMIEKCPDKLTGLVGVHPPDVDGSLREIDRYADRGFIGIKLMPTSGYYPDDEKHRKVFEEVNARKWMVLSHCGWCSRGVKERDLPQSTRFSDPYHIEPLARIYPDIDFILAHGGGRTYFQRAWELTHYHENVYIDTCPGHGPWVLRNGGMWLETLNWERVMFGTDTILGSVEGARRYGDNAERIKEILKEIGAAEHTDAVLHGNAERLLRKHGVEI